MFEIFILQAVFAQECSINYASNIDHGCDRISPYCSRNNKNYQMWLKCERCDDLLPEVSFCDYRYVNSRISRKLLITETDSVIECHADSENGRKTGSCAIQDNRYNVKNGLLTCVGYSSWTQKGPGLKIRYYPLQHDVNHATYSIHYHLTTQLSLKTAEFKRPRGPILEPDEFNDYLVGEIYSDLFKVCSDYIQRSGDYIWVQGTARHYFFPTPGMNERSVTFTRYLFF